jgi:soluble lytic murein transglycosylase-like protein
MDHSDARPGRLARQVFLRRLATWVAVLVALPALAGELALPAFAGENAIFTSGLRLHIDGHEISGGVVRLFNNGGVTEMPFGAIAAFEQDDYIAPPPVPDPPMPVEKAEAPKSADPKQMIEDAALQSGLPKKLVQSVAKAESGLDPKAVSRKGAIGVMQLMPKTARALGYDPRDTQQNIEAGTRLLRELLLKYDGDVVKALAAYNAGEQAVDRYHGVPPYPETRNYVNKIVRDYLSSPDQ